MFNPEKLLGSLLKGGLSHGGKGSNMKAQVGLGLLGLAIGAVEHYTSKSQARPPSAQHDQGGAAPPPSPAMTGAVPPEMPAVPPQVPSGMTAPPPPPGPQPVQAGDAASQNDAVLLIRAMIAAASADGVIDQQERQRILEKYRGANLSPEEQNFLAGELLCPAGIEQLTAEARSVETARRIYAVSLLAVTVDTEAEQVYLQTLGERLGLSARERDAIHGTLGLAGLQP
ncbi:MAG: tellurite resistance TerB family protein [Thermodesulfobacteriota bacterium]